MLSKLFVGYINLPDAFVKDVSVSIVSKRVYLYLSKCNGKCQNLEIYMVHQKWDVIVVFIECRKGG